MLDFILSFIPGGGITAFAGIALAGLLAVWRIVAGIKKSGRDEVLAEDARKRAQNLQDVKRAQDAAAAVRDDPAGELSDPNNRDVRR